MQTYITRGSSRREVLIQFEPYLMFLSSLENFYFHSPDALIESIRPYYYGSHLEYLKDTIYREIGLMKRYGRDTMSQSSLIYMHLATEGLLKMTRTIFDSQSDTLKSLELYNYLSQYIEPIQLISSYLQNTSLNSTSFEQAAYNISAYLDYTSLTSLHDKANIESMHFVHWSDTLQQPSRNKSAKIYCHAQFREMHVHAESTYLFRDALTFVMRHLHLVPQVISHILRTKKNNSTYQSNYLNRRSDEYHVIFRYLRDLARHYRRFYQHPSGISPFIAIRNFHYYHFIRDIIAFLFKLRKASPSSIDPSTFPRLQSAVHALRIINTIMRSYTLQERHTGLLYMMEGYFDAPFRKITRKLRDLVWEQTRHIIHDLPNPSVSRMRFRRESVRNIYDFKISSVTNNLPLPVHMEVRIPLERDTFEQWIFLMHKHSSTFSLVLHYKKAKSEEEALSWWLGYQNSRLPLWQEWLNGTQSIHRVLTQKTQIDISPFLRAMHDSLPNRITGIDAAAIETHTPPWMLRDFFNFWSTFYRFHLHLPPPTPVFHAGEDFINVAVGLRNVYEALYFLHVQRIGHCIAPFIDIERFHARNFSLNISSYQLLLTLFWLTHLYSEYRPFFDKRLNWDMQHTLLTLLYYLQKSHPNGHVRIPLFLKAMESSIRQHRTFPPAHQALPHAKHPANFSTRDQSNLWGVFLCPCSVRFHAREFNPTIALDEVSASVYSFLTRRSARQIKTNPTPPTSS